MAAEIRYAESMDEESVVVAGPAGQYGFGTVGLANPALTLRQAWRMVQRAGLARQANRASARFVGDGVHEPALVEYLLR